MRTRECFVFLQYSIYIISFLFITLSYFAGGAHGGGGPPPSLLPGRAGRRHSIQVNKTLKNPPEVVFKDILYTHSVQGRPLKKQRTVRINMTTRCDFFGFIPGSNSPFSLENIKKERSKNEAKKYITA